LSESPEISEIIGSMPKIDLHRHLEGSLRLSTLMEVARQQKLDLPTDAHALQDFVQIAATDPRTYQNFLSKFRTLRAFYRSPQLIQRFIREAIEDAAKDQVVYLELFFTPVALAQACDFPMAEVVKWVIEAANVASNANGIMVNLIASVNRHESIALAEEVVNVALQHLGRGIVGLDMSGNEVDFPSEPFEGLFRDAKAAGMRITVHAGEWAGAESIGYALERMGAERIGHGVRILEDGNVVALARERGTYFEVCLTSNLQSGVIDSLAKHPLPEMIQAGLQVTLNTDDPGISSITLSHEYRLAIEKLGLSHVTLIALIMTAARGTFLENRKKKALEASLEESFFSFKIG
jgi:adenosine deaminase